MTSVEEEREKEIDNQPGYITEEEKEMRFANSGSAGLGAEPAKLYYDLNGAGSRYGSKFRLKRAVASRSRVGHDQGLPSSSRATSGCLCCLAVW
jgi:hypothetical protein